MRFIIHDSDERLRKSGQIYCDNDKLLEIYNKKGFGVFSPVNEFKSPIRQIRNLKSITKLFVDTDEMPKKQIQNLIRMSLTPSETNETKRGFHLHYEMDIDLLKEFENSGGDVVDACEFFSKIAEERLIPFFKSDVRVKDASRLLRTPGYYHCKDPNDPFLIQNIEKTGFKYSLNDIFLMFPVKLSKSACQKKLTMLLGNSDTEIVRELKENIFTRVNSLSGIIFLEKISGHAIVDGEKYTFKPNSSGHQIMVNGKSTGQWVDKEGKLGGGSFCNTNWVKWYLDGQRVPRDQHWKFIFKVLMELFPELK